MCSQEQALRVTFDALSALHAVRYVQPVFVSGCSANAAAQTLQQRVLTGYVCACPGSEQGRSLLASRGGRHRLACSVHTCRRCRNHIAASAGGSCRLPLNAPCMVHNH